MPVTNTEPLGGTLRTFSVEMSRKVRRRPDPETGYDVFDPSDLATLKLTVNGETREFAVVTGALKAALLQNEATQGFQE